MSKMLQLFEISAKSFTEKHVEKEEKKVNKSDKQLLDRLDSLLDQNKTIAKGIILMEEKIKRRPPTYPLAPRENEVRFLRKPLPKI